MEYLVPAVVTVVLVPGTGTWYGTLPADTDILCRRSHTGIMTLPSDKCRYQYKSYVVPVHHIVQHVVCIMVCKINYR